ncbi:MAG: calmodulin [Amphiamblys sp. WSBS2006]|nr:MAG: calmodulin [Amphiamblys sp. WSBS2006]
MNVSDDQIKDIFSLFDLSGTKTIETKDLGTVLRALWRCPTEEDVAEYIKTIDPESTGKVTLDAFEDLLKKTPPINIVHAKEELQQSFRVFDPNKRGVIQEAELRHILTSLGERLTDEEANEFIQDASPDKDGWINYEELIGRMLSVRK